MLAALWAASRIRHFISALRSALEKPDAVRELLIATVGCNIARGIIDDVLANTPVLPAALVTTKGYPVSVQAVPEMALARIDVVKCQVGVAPRDALNLRLCRQAMPVAPLRGAAEKKICAE